MTNPSAPTTSMVMFFSMSMLKVPTVCSISESARVTWRNLNEESDQETGINLTSSHPLRRLRGRGA